MSKICNVIEKLEDMRHLKPATDNEIKLAEEELKLSFSEEYKEYVGKYGVISACGIELTGVCPSPRLSVVEVTKRERELRNIPEDFYVVDKIGIESIILLQNIKGEVFEVNKSGKVLKRYNSLVEYIESYI